MHAFYTKLYQEINKLNFILCHEFYCKNKSPAGPFRRWELLVDS